MPSVNLIAEIWILVNRIRERKLSATYTKGNVSGQNCGRDENGVIDIVIIVGDYKRIIIIYVSPVIYGCKCV